MNGFDDGSTPSAAESDDAGATGAGGALVDCAKAAIAMQNQPAAMTALRKYLSSGFSTRRAGMFGFAA